MTAALARPAAEPLYVYAILASDAALDPAALSQPGLEAAALSVIPLGPVAALVSTHSGQAVTRTRRNMLAHTRVLEAAMPRTTVLPMRFGTVADDLDMLARYCEAEAERLGARLTALDGLAEYGLRVRFPREPALAALVQEDPGLADTYRRIEGRGAAGHFDRIAFGRRIAEALDERRKRAERRLIVAIKPAVSDYVLRAAEADVEVLRLEVLATADGAAKAAALAEAAAAETGFAGNAPAAVQCIGPAPAYHFVSLSLGPGSPDGSDGLALR